MLRNAQTGFTAEPPSGKVVVDEGNRFISGEEPFGYHPKTGGYPDLYNPLLDHMRASRTALIISILPSIIMLALFYSLVIHTYLSCGSFWPPNGNDGLSPLLKAHGLLAWCYCLGYGLLTAFILPAMALVCLLVRRWRRFILYCGLYLLLFFVSEGLMKLAPEQFLRPWNNWWW